MNKYTEEYASMLEKFLDMARAEETAVLATASGDSVTMRTISPVECDGAVLMFTSPDSRKYTQLRENPSCCLGIANLFAEAVAEFLGATMTDENARYREIYEKKFAGAFDEGVEHGGRESEFVLFRLTNVTGWML